MNRIKIEKLDGSFVQVLLESPKTKLTKDEK